MAKHTAARTGTSRIRFIMLDAEIPDGDLTQVTQAIQNALKPPTPILHQRVLSAPPPASERQTDDPQSELFASMNEADGEVIDAESVAPVQAKLNSPRRPRKYPTPKVLTDVDLNTEVSLTDFASDKQPKSGVERYLVVAAWFKEHRGLDAVSADHIYTGFRKLGWSTSIEDFAKPLRSLKQAQLVGGAGRGQFAINHLGLDRVQKMVAG